MVWNDEGIVLSSRKYGEKRRFVNILTKEHGKTSGFYGIMNRNAFSVMSKVEINFIKTHSNFGYWEKKIEQQNWIYLFNSKAHISMCQSICTLLDQALPFNLKYIKIYDFLVYIINSAKFLSQLDIVKLYTYFEFLLLNEIGFGFDLHECGVCGKSENLHFLSPKTGRAASRECAANYKGTLFVIPSFWKIFQNLTSYEEVISLEITESELKSSLNITWHFIRIHIPNVASYFRDSIF
jgi:DNA repair protein RecO (recombination protein O)